MKGMHWYVAELDWLNYIKPGLVWEATPCFTFPQVPYRIARYFPALKIIVLFRNPIDRCYSHYLHERMVNWENCKTFEKALEAEVWRKKSSDRFRQKHNDAEPSLFQQHFFYQDWSEYDTHMEHWFRCFPRSRIHVVESEAFWNDPKTTMAGVCTFLDIDPDGWSPNFNWGKVWAFKQNYLPMKSETREMLRDRFTPHVERLKEMLGREFTTWKDFR